MAALPGPVGADVVALSAWVRSTADLVLRARSDVRRVAGALAVDAVLVDRVVGGLRRVQARLDGLATVAARLAAVDGLQWRRGTLAPAPPVAAEPVSPAADWRRLDARHRATVLARLHAGWTSAPLGQRPPILGARGLAALLGADALLDVDVDAGRAVAVFGDLERADHVAIVVPGIGNGLTNVADLIGDASAIRRVGGDRVAAIAWLGYDAPGGLGTWELLTQAWHGGRAGPAAADLSAFVNGLRSSMDAATLTVIGHSYGARVVAEALHDPGLPVQDVVLLGAPGLGPGIDDVGDLATGGATVWAEAVGDPWPHDLVDRAEPVARPVRLLLDGLGQAPLAWQLGTTVLGRLLRREDPVPYLPGAHGGDPDRASFGACGFATGDVRGHGAYFTGTSLDSIVAIVTGRAPAPDTDRWSACRG